MKYFYIETIALLTSLVTLSKVIQWFTREPPSNLYVSVGGTARLEWDYNVRNRTALFDPYSPEWALYDTSGGRIVIGVEDGYNGWKFIINKKCPPKLRGRLSIESTAILVIYNVTKVDERLYECSLLLLVGSPMKSKVQLVVTERPRFTTPVNISTPINEGSSLCIRCSAAADPMPNITWVRIIKNPKIISKGVGEAFLRFINITRHQRGTYECQATNNPNENQVTTRTKISEKYPVEPANVFVSDIKATSAVINWDSPVDDGGSPVIEYKVQINTIPPREVITETTYCVTKDLNENTTYGVKVYARNAVGYGKAVRTEFTTKEPKRKGWPISTAIEKRNFAISHLSITCALVIVIVVLITYIYIKFKRNFSKVADNREEITRFASPVLDRTAHEDEIPVPLTTMEQSTINNVLSKNASKTSPNEDYERISE
ncbi:Down syndrome cell adhesion molecule-like, partial [Actinia tenebrosa]|uniref:Down syndrome cell adhesion molecule-like n=1 Tax=Actinia tenebrosa TaxID=6105 RepID=A0A6P8HGZ0_ACTTE